MLAPQLFLLILLGVSVIFRSLGFSQSRPVSGIYPLIAGLFRKAINSLIQSRYADMPAHRRDQLEAAIGMIGQSRTIYGHILFRPIFIIGQIFGIAFNLGLTTILLTRIMITDLAFGWQSTLQPAAETIHHIVRFIALPWSWALPASYAHPTVEQIEGSQFVYKEGIHHLTSPDLSAWWPFLFMVIIVYGLLPRLFILGGTVFRQRRAINRLSFNHAACDRLLLAMRTPRVDTRSRRYTGNATSLKDAEAAAYGADSQSFAPISDVELEAALVLVPAEIDAQCEDAALSEKLRRRLGLDLRARITCQMDPDTDMAAIKEKLSTAKAGSQRLVLLQEAWQPPIQEMLYYITAIRRQMSQQPGGTGSLVIGLIGKPGLDSIFTPPTDTDRLVWVHAIAKLGDPYIRVESLGEPP